jgi:hypothetical protein
MNMSTNIRAVSPKPDAEGWRDTPIFVMTDLNFIVICTVTALLVAFGLAILLPLPNDASDFWMQFTSNAP